MIEMTRNAPESRSRDVFACSNALWLLLQDLGRGFGWQPKGTTYLPSGKRVHALPARHDYHPGDALDGKQLDDEDALAWARALETAQQSPRFPALLAEHCNDGPEPHATEVRTLHSLIYEFMTFAYGGAFNFSEVPSTGDEALTALLSPRAPLGPHHGTEPEA